MLLERLRYAYQWRYPKDYFDRLDAEANPQAVAMVVSRELTRDTAHDEERQASLRKHVFALAGDDGVDFDTLLDRVLASLPQPLRTAPTERDYV